MVKDPTNMAPLYVASYRFMHAVRSKRPVNAAKIARKKRPQKRPIGMVSSVSLFLAALRRVRESLIKF